MEAASCSEMRSFSLLYIYHCAIGDVEKMDMSTALPKNTSSETWKIFITQLGIAF